MSRVPVALTFDNMGNAADIGRGTASAADAAEPGLRVGYPRIERLLHEFGLRATFFVEGWNALHHGPRIESLLAAGHEVGLHGWIHEPWSRLDAGQEAAILAAGKAGLDAHGAQVRGFRAPGGARTERTLGLLAEAGFGYDASMDDAGPRRDGSGVVVLPFTWPAVDWWWYSVHEPPATAVQWHRAWEGLLDDAAARAVPLVLVAHARISAVDEERSARLEALLRRIAADDARFEPVLMRDLAARYR